VAEQAQGTDFGRESYDALAAELQQLRFAAGDVSYAEIVRRIAVHREQDGVSPPASRPARTTIYDAFRLGRRRVNPTLVGEIVRALGADETGVAQWEERCLAVRSNLERSLEQELAPLQESGTASARVTLRAAIVLIAGCVGINLLGFWIVPLLGLPLYLDMIGTAIAAIAMGPWYGVLVGVTTNAIGVSITDSSSIAFCLVNAAGALVWGYGVRRFRIFESISRYLLLNAVVAVVCTVVASTLLVIIFHGGTGHASESTTEKLVAMGEPLTLAVVVSNLVHSLADKIIAGFAVLAVLDRIRHWFDVPFYATLAPFQPSGLQRPAEWLAGKRR
jgi:energy-coupling factor transport system substrate-specific component